LLLSKSSSWSDLNIFVVVGVGVGYSPPDISLVAVFFSVPPDKAISFEALWSYGQMFANLVVNGSMGLPLC